jgi:hypothetical protein
MSQDRLGLEPEVEIDEPDVPLDDDDVEIPLDDEPDVTLAVVPSSLPLMEVLAADFPLPALIRFVPNVRLKASADQATAYALSIDVTGADGLKHADLALAALRGSLKAIEGHFEEPAKIADALHKSITGKRAEWLADGKRASDKVGRAIWAENTRLEQIAAEARRKAQEDEDRKAREEARREAEAAAKSQAPPQVVEELQRRAETATAPPVATPVLAPSLTSSTTVTTWKCRLQGTAADAEPNPKMAELSPGQIAQVKVAMKAVLAGEAPIAIFELAWSYLNTRAKGDRSTFNVPGFESFKDGGTRAKGARRR